MRKNFTYDLTFNLQNTENLTNFLNTDKSIHGTRGREGNQNTTITDIKCKYTTMVKY